MQHTEYKVEKGIFFFLNGGRLKSVQRDLVVHITKWYNKYSGSQTVFIACEFEYIRLLLEWERVVISNKHKIMGLTEDADMLFFTGLGVCVDLEVTDTKYGTGHSGLKLWIS